MDYITYLTTFDHLFDVPKEKKNMEYQKYLHRLLEYLDEYTQRVKPLLSLPNEMDSVVREFEQQWETGTFPGWPVTFNFFLKGHIAIYKLFAERSRKCTNKCRCASGLVGIFLLGGARFTRTRSSEVGLDGSKPEVWRVNSSLTLSYDKINFSNFSSKALLKKEHRGCSAPRARRIWTLL